MMRGIFRRDSPKFFDFYRRPKGAIIKKSCKSFNLQDSTAEREGFEPPVPCSTPVFKTGAFDHSAISPKMLYSGLNRCKDTECF